MKNIKEIKQEIFKNIDQGNLTVALSECSEFFSEIDISMFNAVEMLVLARLLAHKTGRYSLSSMYNAELDDILRLIQNSCLTEQLKDTEIKDMYNSYWEKAFSFDASYKNHSMNDLCLSLALEFDSVLEIGTGNGDGVKKMLAAGKKARGVEYSNYLYENLLKNKFPGGEVIEGDGSALIFEDNSFDMTVSFDVLEHMPEEKAIKAVQEIARVTKKYFFGTISSDLDMNQKYHLTVRPPLWWQKRFEEAGLVLIKDDYPELKKYEEVYFYVKES